MNFMMRGLIRQPTRSINANAGAIFLSLRMKKHPVSGSVNSPENDTPHLLARVGVEVGETLSLF